MVASQSTSFCRTVRWESFKDIFALSMRMSAWSTSLVCSSLDPHETMRISSIDACTFGKSCIIISSVCWKSASMSVSP